MAIARLEIVPPADFIEEEVVTTWRTAAQKNLKDPKLLHFQASVRPNLIATQRLVKEGTALGDLMAQVCGDLARHVEGLTDIETTEFQFEDGTTGLLLKYMMPVHGKFTVYQLQAGRIDGHVFTTLTISTEASRLTEDDLKSYLTCIARASVKTIE